MARIIIDEKKLRMTIRQHILEQTEIESKEQKPRCVAGNVIPLDDIVGPAKSFQNYSNKIYKREGGINGMVDETNNGCINAMDKVIELYKENQHGEELVKDIEKVLGHPDPTSRAKEYLKRCLVLVKEK